MQQTKEPDRLLPLLGRSCQEDLSGRNCQEELSRRGCQGGAVREELSRRSYQEESVKKRLTQFELSGSIVLVGIRVELSSTSYKS